MIRLRPTPRLAVIAMLAAVATFGANFPLSRYGIGEGLSPYDIVALRYGVAGLVLLPVFLSRGVRDCAGVGWGRGAVLALTSGAVITLFMSYGAALAPAAHGAALGPGTTTVVGVVAGAVMAGAMPPPLTRVGLGLTLLGLLAIAVAGTTSGPAVALGDLCFFLTGLLWGFYPVLLHRWRVDGIVGATICAVLSLAYLPIYFAFLEPRLLQVPPSLVLWQALYQGVLNSVGALWLWGYAVRILGAGGTALFPPLIPVVGSLLAIPILDERPGPIQALGIVAIVAGLALAAWGNRARLRNREAGDGAA